jgi:hypothetical protein
MRLKFHTKKVFLTVLALVGGGLLGKAGAQTSLNLQISDSKSFRQIGNQRPLVFQGGRFRLTVSDGYINIRPCFGNGRPFKIFPTLGCEAGTTGFVTSGDIDNDGIRDDRSFWSIDMPVAARVVDVFRVGDMALVAAPPSDFPRPLIGKFKENSLEVWYNVLEPPAVRYQISYYFYNRDYPSGGKGILKQRREIVEGVYSVQVPIRPEVVGGNQGVVQVINATLNPMIEGYPGASGLGNSNDWLLTEPTNWCDYTSPTGEFDRVLELDPRLFNEFKWSGINGSTTLPFVDTFTFSMVDTTQNDLIVYPPYGPDTPPGDRDEELLLGVPQGIGIGPYVMEPGMKVTARLAVQRNLQTSAVAWDRSGRVFEWGVYFIDSYEGWALAGVPSPFPVGTATDRMKPNVDFDGDGWTNLQEFAFNTEPANPASVPLIRPYLDPDTNQIVLDVIKRPHVGHSLIYQIEYSSDRENWTAIERGDPVYFLEFDNSERIKVRSRNAFPGEKNGFFRVKLTRMWSRPFSVYVR